jgi:hypothetical protein
MVLERMEEATMNESDPSIQAALAAVGLPGLQVVADAADVAAMERTPGCTVTFATALRMALEAFLADDRGSGQSHDSAMAVVRDMPESFGLGAKPTDAEIGAALRKLLADDPQAKIVLLSPATIKQPDYRFEPEYGESIAENWVFRIIAPASWPFLQWSIVDLRGARPAYSYEFD